MAKNLSLLLIAGTLASSPLSCACKSADARKTAAPLPANVPRITHVDAAQAAELLQRPGIVVLDLRTQDEFAAGHLAGAQLLDFFSPKFEAEVGRLDRRKPYLIYCGSGGRSTQALVAFEELRFQSVIHLDGGIAAWKKAGQPLQK